MENFIYSPSGVNAGGIILGATRRSNFAGIVFISFARDFPFSPSPLCFFSPHRWKMISFGNWARWTAVKWSGGSSFASRSRNETLFVSARDRRIYRSHRSLRRGILRFTCVSTCIFSPCDASFWFDANTSINRRALV